VIRSAGSRTRSRRRSHDFVQDTLFEVQVRPERRFYRQMLDALARSDFGAFGVPSGGDVEAELTVSKLFGTVWLAQRVPRDGSVEEAFGLGLVEYAAQHLGPASATLLRVMAVLAPVREVREAAAGFAGLVGPQWTEAVAGACWAFEDAYGDHTTIVNSYGPTQHALVVQVDHGLSGAAVDASFTLDVDDTVTALRLEATASAGVSTMSPIDQPWARSMLARAIARSDLIAASDLQPGFAELRALALARVAVLTDGPDPLEPVVPPASVLLAEFMASPEAQALPSRHLAQAVATLLVEYGESVDAGQVARVSPLRWETFLLDWWPARAVAGDWAAVLRAWSSWAGRRMALPPTARTELAVALDDLLAAIVG
jgi:hypothetical protein